MKKKIRGYHCKTANATEMSEICKKKHIFLKMCNDFDLKICILKIEADIASLGSGQRNTW